MIRRGFCLFATLATFSCAAHQPAEKSVAAAGAAGAADSAGGTAETAEMGGSSAGSESTSRGGAADAAGAPDELPSRGLAARPPNGACRVTWSDPKAPPKLLSATGCVDVADRLKPAEALIPFSVLSPLWSDSAEKERFMLIPDDQQITVKDCELTPEECPDACIPGLPCELEGEFQFPTGTILVKNFSLGTKRIETRLMVHFSTEEWFGHSYKWREDSTDADLVDRLGEDVVYPVGKAEQTWHYPSGAECMQCHTVAAGFSLGPEVMQLNSEHTYPNGVTANQLDTLEAIGLFSDAISARLKTTKLAAYDDDAASLESRARSYLHANCSQCHRPGSNKPTVDFRFVTRLSQTSACNADSAVQNGSLGIDGAKIIAPGAHARSLVWARMDTLEKSVRMPQLATGVRDDAGAKLVADWIDNLTLADCAK